MVILKKKKKKLFLYSWFLYSLIVENIYTEIKIYVKSITLAL